MPKLCQNYAACVILSIRTYTEYNTLTLIFLSFCLTSKFFVVKLVFVPLLIKAEQKTY